MNGSHNLSYLMQHMQNHPPKDTVENRGLIEVNSDESNRVFPFQATPSGNLKIIPNQVRSEDPRYLPRRNHRKDRIETDVQLF